MLAEPMRKGETRPTADLALALVRITRRGCRIVEVSSGASSDDPDALDAAILRAMEGVAKGRTLTSARASEIGEPGRKLNIEMSAENRLKRPEYRKHLAAMKSIWRNTIDFKHRKEAAAAINAMLAENKLDPIGSAETLYRLWEGRTGRKSK